jgi:hypothetical protein
MSHNGRPRYAGGFGVWLPDPELLFSQARDWLAAQAAAVPEAGAVFLEGYPAAEACDGPWRRAWTSWWPRPAGGRRPGSRSEASPTTSSTTLRARF